MAVMYISRLQLFNYPISRVNKKAGARGTGFFRINDCMDYSKLIIVKY